MSSVKNSIYNWRSGDADRNPATNHYKGLVTFIADIRSARARDLEEKRVNKELANIRQKFKDPKLSSYDKKKYVSKLLYIYIMGYDLDFGHLEAVNLVSGSKFSEKQIGYLAITLFFHEEHELLHLVVNSIRKDLLDQNELHNCLALHAIANVGGRTMGESFGSEVHRLLISPASGTFVKKKAALTLLRLYRKHPPTVQPEWAERIIAMMDDQNMGVALSVTSLILALAKDDPDNYKGSYVKAANRLKKIVIDMDCTEEYHYYRVACPWMQVKLLRLMQYYPPSGDSHIQDLLRNSIGQILHSAVEIRRINEENKQSNVQQNNAQNAILFEAIKLVIHMDTEEQLMVQISSKLGDFISARETNVRYLGLDAMTHLATRGETLEPLRKHQKLIFALLRDRDVTVKRQALDLLYSMCDQMSSAQIVHELLKQLQVADNSVREEMVLKVAILAERFATDAQWYVDVSLRLLAMAGDHVSDEVWQRIVQIVTNNEELQVYAVKHILRYVKADQCHESLAKIGAYLLGEFGHLIADDEGCSPIEQFNALQTKMWGGSTETRAIILSAYVKFVNLFPEIQPQVLSMLRGYSEVMDPELQQRACEYLAVVNMPTDDLLRTVFDEMPPFPERQSALLSRVRVRSAATGDRRTASGGLDKRLTMIKTGSGDASPLTNTLTGLPSDNTTIPTPTTNGHSDLSGLDFSPTPTPAKPSPHSQLTAGWRTGYTKLLLRPEGVLHEDAQLQIGLRSEYRAQTGCVILYFKNKTSYDITSFTTTLDNDANLGVLRPDMKSLPDTELASGAQTQQTIMFEARNSFATSPFLKVSYLAGAMQSLTLMLPVALHKYMEPATLTSEDFFKRWAQIGGGPRQAQATFGLSGPGSSKRYTMESTRQVLEGFRWGILDGVDKKENFVGATVLHTSTGGKFGCLLRLEPKMETFEYRLTVRATGEAVPGTLLGLMRERLEKGEGALVG